MNLPTQARVVIIGGGAIGTSIAYHLTKLGVTDVVLLERGQLTSGTTWHAAGLFMQLRSTRTMTDIARYGAELFPRLEAETGFHTGFKRCGSLPIARTHERLHEIARLVSLGKVFGVDAHMVSPEEAGRLFPLLDPKTIVGGAFIPGDGTINPVDLTNAFAKGARNGGVKIFEGVTVTGFDIQGGGVRKVMTDKGTIACEKVVVASGLWSRDLAQLAGVAVPLYAAAHMYVTTETHASIPKMLPVLRDTDGFNYVKEDAGRLLVGAFEPNAKALPIENLPKDQSFIELPEDWDQFELPMSKAIEAVPLVAQLGIRHFMNGPESFTPDNRFVMGEAPQLKNFFVAAGFNSQGILTSPGVGKVMAEWVASGRPDIDLSEVDISRFSGFETNPRFLKARIPESLGLLFQMHWPHRQFETARNIRKTPLYEKLKAANACFGTVAGVERANWYAPEGIMPGYEYSFGKQNWFEAVRGEHEAARNKVAMFDMSTFGKVIVQGRDACSFLNRVVAAEVDRPIGSVIYTQMLNEFGGIVSDLTFTRLAKDSYLMVTGASQQARDFNWMKSHVRDDEFVTLTDVTAGYGTLSVTGPLARELLQKVSDEDFSNEAFPFGTAKEIFIGMGKALAVRISYCGELAWEIYPATDYLSGVFDALMEAGKPLGLRLAGYHALDCLRSEKGFVHWGHDVTPEDTPIEAGLGFAVDRVKTNFIGYDVIAKQRGEPLKRRLVHFALLDSDAMLHHDEPIFMDGKVAGIMTSGAYGYTLGRSVGSGYLNIPEGQSWSEYIRSGSFEVEIAGVRHAADVSAKPFYDPEGKRPKS